MSSSGLNTNTSAPSKVTGQINSLVGTGEELLGKAIEVVSSVIPGTSNEPSQFTTAGKELHAKGEAEIKAAQVQGYAEGTVDRVEGKVKSVTGAITGDSLKQTEGNLQGQKGEAQQEINK